MEDFLNEILEKRPRYEDYGSDESNLQPELSPESINSQLAPFVIKAESLNQADSREGEEDGEGEGPVLTSLQDFLLPGTSNPHKDLPPNVLNLLRKEASQLNDVDLHILITKCKAAPVIFRRRRDETYSTLMFSPSGVEARSESTNYVECLLCAKIFTRSGGHLKRHRSKHFPELEAGASPFNPLNGEHQSPQQKPTNSQSQAPLQVVDRQTRQNASSFHTLPFDPNTIRPQEREDLARVLTQLCVQEGLSPGIVQRRAFIELVTTLLNLGLSRNQPIPAISILPPGELITTCIYRRFHYLAQDKVPQIQTDLLIYGGSFVVGCLPSAPKITALSIHYFDQKWTMKKAVLGLAPADASDDSESPLTWTQCLDSVATVTMQPQTLNQLVCVSGNGSAVWAGRLKPENRYVLCSCDLIERIVDQVFVADNKLTKKPGDDIHFAASMVDAANLIMKYARFQTFSYAVKTPPETVYKWLKNLRIVEFARDELENLQLFATNPEIHQVLPKEFFDALHLLDSNQADLAELIKFLRVFRAAIVELQVIDVPTLPLVWPAIMTLQFDLRSFVDDCESQAFKTLTERAIKLIERDFELLVKDEHRTATFLNPKQRKLQHLLDPAAYEKFKNQLRTRLGIEKPQVESNLGDKRRRFYEDDDSEETQDEIDRYLAIKRSLNETIVEFWRRNENVLPKLSAEARRLLACPASTNYVCGNLSHYVGKMTEFSIDAIAKLVVTRSLENI